jgi:SAM-dependent methyltransferase
VRFVRSFARVLLWPVLRFFDPRFQGLAQQGAVLHDDVVRNVEASRAESRLHAQERQEQITAVRGELSELRTMLAAEMDATSEATTVLGRSLSDLLGEADRLQEMILAAQGDAITEAYVDRVRDRGVDELDERLADVLNFATSYRGFAAQRNLWFNPPLVVEHHQGDVRVSVVNERIVEVPYVMRALGSLEPGAAVLDVGAVESTLAFSLATLGFRVTALDLHAYPLEHPNLRSVQAAVQDWETEETFDAVTCLSTVEHIGLGAYGESQSGDGADVAAMRRIRELAKPGGVLVLTVPYGVKSQNEVQRTYDRAGLEELVEGWEVDDLTILSHVDSRTWVIEDADSASPAEQVALVTAHRA